MSRLARRIKDKRVLYYIRQMLKAGMMDKEGIKQKREQGTPQGGPLSPLLANVLLDDLDRELERRGLHYFRAKAQSRRTSTGKHQPLHRRGTEAESESVAYNPPKSPNAITRSDSGTHTCDKGVDE